MCGLPRGRDPRRFPGLTARRRLRDERGGHHHDERRNATGCEQDDASQHDRRIRSAPGREEWGMRSLHRAARIEPGPGQESVWDYPRPPRVEPVADRIRVAAAGVTIADTTRALRVLETASPPAYYLPAADVRMDLLVPSPTSTVCEWKGVARYWSLRAGDRVVRDVAWSYERPRQGFEAIAGWLAFYAGRVDAAWVGDERVVPQLGDFYGGWVTSRIVGPFKGDPGTLGW